MKIERRNFLKKIAGVCVLGSCGKAVGDAASAASATPAAVTTAEAAGAVGAAGLGAAGAYRAGVRAQVFEVIVRQACNGAPWREICAGPMQVNGICAKEVEDEVARRMKGEAKSPCSCGVCDRSHRASGFCTCDDCAKARVKTLHKYFQELDKIPHSEVSPCACSSCRQKVNQLIAEFRTDLA